MATGCWSPLNTSRTTQWALLLAVSSSSIHFYNLRLRLTCYRIGYRVGERLHAWMHWSSKWSIVITLRKTRSAYCWPDEAKQRRTAGTKAMGCVRRSLSARIYATLCTLPLLHNAMPSMNEHTSFRERSCLYTLSRFGRTNNLTTSSKHIFSRTLFWHRMSYFVYHYERYRTDESYYSRKPRIRT